MDNNYLFDDLCEFKGRVLLLVSLKFVGTNNTTGNHFPTRNKRIYF